MSCGFGGNTCGACGPQLSCNGGGACVGQGDTCGSSIDITGWGDVYLPIDTCSYVNDVTINGCSGGPAPDMVFSGVTGSLYHFDAPPGWIVGYLDPGGSCSSSFGNCGMSYGAAGSTGFPRQWFAVERADGGCGRATIHIQAM
jgi:hypothetical protein